MSYAAVNTKAVAVYARFLKPEVPLKILEAGNIKDGLAILESTWGLELTENPHLLEVNVKMEQKVYDTLNGFHYYLQGSARSFYNALLTRYEIQDLKRIFRAVYHDEDVGLVRKSLLALDPMLLPKDQTLGPDELFKVLEATPYGRMLSAYKGVSRDRILFYIEMELDRSYYERLIKEARELPKKDRKEIMAMLNRHVDLLNIRYIYRGKKTYDILKSEMENFVIHGGNIPPKLLKSWIYAEDVDALVRSVRNSSFSFLFQEKRNNQMADILATRDLAAVYEKHYQQAGLSLGRIVALSILLENAIKDVSTILEGLRLGFGKDLIRSLLTIPMKEGEVWQ